MPNVPPRSLSGRSIDLGEGAATDAIDVVATLIGETTPRLALEVWAGDAAGVPQLVWARNTDGPAAATMTYLSGTPASAGKVRVSWTPLSPLRSDSYQIKRPDGSVAGTATQFATSFDDTAPRPLNGPYVLIALLAGVPDASPASTNTVNMSTGPASMLTPINGGSYWRLQWTAPAWGKPHQYRVYRNGVLVTTLDGGTLSYDDTGWTPGVSSVYQVFAVESGVQGGGSGTATVNHVPLDPINVSLASPAPDLLRLNFQYPGGSIARYEVQRYDVNVGAWANHDLNNVSGQSDWSTTTTTGYMRVRSIGTNGQASNYVQVGPVNVTVPLPQALGYYGPHPSQWPNQNRAISAFEANGVTLCGEYYWANFPGWHDTGWVLGPACQTLNGGNSAVWDISRLQFSPTYFRVRRYRAGLYSDWVQYGPV